VLLDLLPILVFKLVTIPEAMLEKKTRLVTWMATPLSTTLITTSVTNMLACRL